MVRLRDAWPYVRPFRRKLLLAFMLSLAGAGTTLIQPLVVANVVDSFESRLPVAMVILLAGLLMTSALLTGLYQLILERTSERLVFHIRQKAITRILRLPIGVIERRTRGDLVARITSDATAMRESLSKSIVDLTTHGITIVVALVVMGFLDPVLTMLVVTVVGAVVISTVLIGRRTRGAAHKHQAHVGYLAAKLERALGGIKTIRATVSTDREIDRTLDDASSALQAGFQVARLKAVVSSFTGVSVQVILLTVIGVGTLRVAAGSLTVGQLGAFVMYVLLIATPALQFASIITSFYRAMGAFARVDDILSLPIETDDENNSGTHSPDWAEANVFEFQNVSYRYPNDFKWVLRNVDLRIAARQVTAIVGSSGAGKSTLFSLMERFYEPTVGKITFLGVDTRFLCRDDVRSHIAYVEQDAPALAGTVRDNLLLGSHEASDRECIEALQMSRLIPSTMSPVEFLNTEVGENGVLLSGGERQRLAIARALLSNASILLLDEATSNLDSTNERELQSAIDGVSAEKTVVVIAHRLSTAVGADTIIVMNGGHPVDQGNHHSLLMSCALYRGFAEHQRFDRKPEEDRS